MIEKDALKLFGKRLASAIPVQASAPLPSELARLVDEMRKREEVRMIGRPRSAA